MVDSSHSDAQTGKTIAVVLPIKAFEQAKDRLSSVLTSSQRKHLAQTTALGVIEAARDAHVFVVCDNDEVALWATSHGATVVPQIDSGLNAAVREGVAATYGYERVMIVHSDIPLPNGLGDLLSAQVADNTVVIVPDRHQDGTNVLVIPTNCKFDFHYGAKSFNAHVAEAKKLGLEIQIINDDELALDIDTPDDLHALPAQWLQQHGI